MSFKVISVPGANTRYSAATRAGDFIFLSGQASVNLKTGELVEDTFEGEVRRTMENTQTVLRAAGADLSDVVQVGAWLRDEADLPRFNELYEEYFTSPFPARTNVGNPFQHLKVKIDCIAYVGKLPD